MKVLAAVIAIVVVLFVFVRVTNNEYARAHPPDDCLIFGGKWNIWDGWHCG